MCWVMSMGENDGIQPLLSEATYDQIVYEIARRYPNAVITVLDRPGASDERFRYRTIGSLFTAIGLCEAIAEELRKRVVDCPDEEEEDES